MEKIDWSKAPEGATHWMQESSEWLEGFWKRAGTANYFYEKGEWVFSGGKPFGHPKLIARPCPTWNGEGNPPVGVDIEVLHELYGYIGARVVGRDGLATIVRTNDGYAGVFAHQMRPIRTPKQIAADEREAAIKDMLEDAGRPDTAKTRDQAQLLYDAGWRKVERAQ